MYRSTDTSKLTKEQRDAELIERAKRRRAEVEGNA